MIFDFLKRQTVITAFPQGTMNLIQQISHLGVFLETLARGGNDHESALRIVFYNIDCMADGFSTCQ